MSYLFFRFVMRVITTLSLKKCFLFFVLFLSFQSFAQNNCGNAGFEYGTWDGFDVYYGSISGLGDISINNIGTIGDQHMIMLRSDGYDPISASFCDVNDSLPVVGDGLGEYSLRLGNSEGGAYAAKVVLDLEVTPDISFLVLNYAVILEDPNHDEAVQPKFFMHINNEDGEILDCGNYEVTSSDSIEGFENCGSWRVRKWTAAGFELQSYLGQHIQIEVAAIDCGLGAHGGYAYIDLTCRPLEIVLDNYCPDETYAYMTVTPGFDAYLWSTGDTTNQISIEDPVPGTYYSVDVTSATGCQITLFDTLPYFETLPLPVLDQFQDTTLCFGENFMFVPTGENIDGLYLIGSGYVYDSLLINTLTDRTYQFVATDDYGCLKDTMSFTVTVLPSPAIIDSEIIPIHCNGLNNGQAIFNCSVDSTIEYSLDGINFQENNSFLGLAEGDYTVITKNGFGCTSEFDFSINSQLPATINYINTHDANCNNLGSVWVTFQNYQYPINYSLDGINYENSNVLSNIDTGQYILYTQDKYGCIDSAEFEILMDPSPLISDVLISEPGCFPGDFNATVIANGFSNLYYSYNNHVFSYTNEFLGLESGLNYFVVRDNNYCFDTFLVVIPELDLPVISDVIIQETSCSISNGSLEVILEGGTYPYQYEIIDVGIQNDSIFQNLSVGDYVVIVSDSIGCLDTSYISLDSIAHPQITDIYIENASCDIDNGSIDIHVQGGVSPYQYSINGTDFMLLSLFDNLSAQDYDLIIKDNLDCIDTSSVEIEKIPPPSIDQIMVTPETCLYDNGMFQATVIEGTEPILYSLDNSNYSLSNTFNNLPSSSYVLYIKDANECIDSLGVIVDEKIPPILSESFVINETCTLSNGSIELFVENGSNPFQFSVDGINYQDTSFFPNLIGGVYTFYVSDSDGCIDTHIVNLISEIPPSLQIDSVKNSTCNLDNGYIEVNVSNGEESFNFSIDGNNYQTSNVFEMLPSGNHVISVIDSNNCIDSIEFEVLFIAPVNILNSEVYQTKCGEDLVNINVNVEEGVGSLQYSVDGLNFQQENSFSDLPSGQYTLFVQDSNNCLDTLDVDVFAIEPPEILDIISSDINCELLYDSINVVTQYGIPPLEYSLDGEHFQDFYLFDSVSPGSYTVFVVDDIGCIDSIDLDLLSMELPVIADLLAIDTICDYNSGTIEVLLESGLSPLEYSINGIDFQDSSLFSGLASGEYSILVRDSNGCIDLKDIELKEIANLEISDAIVDRMSCYNQKARVELHLEGGNKPIVFSKDDIEYSDKYLFDNLESNMSYTFYSKDTLGCSDSIEISIPLIELLNIESIDYEIQDCNSALVSIEYEATKGCSPFSISFNGLTYSYNDFLEISLPIDTYYITITDSCGCRSNAYLRIENPQNFYIPSGFSPKSGISTNQYVKIFSDEPFEVLSYKIFNRWGNVIYIGDESLNIEDIWWDGTINGQFSQSGVYVYLIEISDKCGKRKVFSGDITLLY